MRVQGIGGTRKTLQRVVWRPPGVALEALSLLCALQGDPSQEQLAALHGWS